MFFRELRSLGLSCMKVNCDTRARDCRLRPESLPVVLTVSYNFLLEVDEISFKF